MSIQVINCGGGSLEYVLDSRLVTPTGDLKFIAGKLHQRFEFNLNGKDAGWFPVPSYCMRYRIQY